MVQDSGIEPWYSKTVLDDGFKKTIKTIHFYGFMVIFGYFLFDFTKKQRQTTNQPNKETKKQTNKTNKTKTPAIVLLSF